MADKVYKIAHAKSFFTRLKGLIGESPCPPLAMLFEHCSSVHTLFMRYPIDIVYLKQTNRCDDVAVFEVLDVVHALPWRFPKSKERADAVLELLGIRAEDMGLYPNKEFTCHFGKHEVKGGCI